MKRLLCVFVVFFAFSTRAANLDEAVLQTANGECRIHYLTQKNTQGWRIETTAHDCPNGLLNGYADVTVLNAFGQVVDQIYGYFSSGYWTGNQHLNAPVLKRFSDERGVQKALFIAGSNKELRIDYIGQMAAQKNTAGVYNPLSFCGPFRMLAVTQNVNLFNDETSVQEVIDDAAENARVFCPAEKRVMLFASTKMEPKQTDIFFFIDIDLQTGKHNVITKDDSKPSVIKQEGGEVVSLVIPERKKMPAIKRGYIDRTKQPIVSPMRPIVPVEPDSFAPVATFDEAVMSPEPESIVETAQEAISPELLKKREMIADKAIEPIAHLKVMVNVLKHPVQGSAIVHIESVGLDGKAKTDEPVPLTLYGQNFKRGWAVITGVFTFDGDSPLAHVDVTETVTCAAPMCKDLRP